jgi:hypothetical protein
VDRFVARYRSAVTAVLSGFDRLVFRGWLLRLIMNGGMYGFLCRARVTLLDFKPFVFDVSERVKEAALREAREHERPIRYLESSTIDKEALARRLLEEHPIEQGLICVLTAVEPCMSFEYHRSPNPKERGLKLRHRKCLHIYQYYRHPMLGFMNARIQTWFPFNIQICINGREWLGTQLKALGVTAFKRNDNCFTWLGDPDLAQRLMNTQLETNWKRALDSVARMLNPLHRAIFKPWPMDYYWTAYQSEWATDVLFKDPKSLAAIYPALTAHATQHFKSADVMRFLGKKAHGNYTGELVTSFKDRAEGVRVKHWASGNSIKMYDKAASVLRVETTIAKTAGFKVLRPPHDDPKGKLAYRPMRKCVADLHRRAQLSQRSNEHYLEALAAVDDTTPLKDIFDDVSKPTTYRERRVRALKIGDPADVGVLEAISRGEFATAGFRNRDIRVRLFPQSKNASPDEVRKLAARTSRLLRVLRAHGVIQKIHKTHRYRLTKKGQLLTAALFAARGATLKQIIGTAA